MMKPCYKLHNETKDKIKTFTDINKALAFKDGCEEDSFDNYFLYYVAPHEDLGDDEMSFILNYVSNNGGLNFSQFYLHAKVETVEGEKKAKFRFTQDFENFSEWHSSVNKSIKALVQHQHDEEEKYYRDMEGAYFGAGECSTCRGGGCFHCEPGRFI